MGVTFSIGHTRANQLQHLNSNTCEDSLEKTNVYIKSVIKQLGSVKDFKSTSDFKKYGLYPGQQIRRTTKNILPHAAIYLYDGNIIEMGSSTKKCSRNLGNPLQINEHITGLTTLKNFMYHAKNNVYKIVTPSDQDSKEIIKRLNRSLSIIGKNKYNAFTDNCIHAANYISHGRKSLISINNLVKEKLVKEKMIKN